MTTHMVIGDTQAKSGVSLDYMRSIGELAAERQPDVIVMIGDHWDFPSLSSYDKGKLAAEGRRLVDDLEAGHEGMRLMMAPIESRQAYLKKTKSKQWKPRLVFTAGNHEDRFDRMARDQPEFAGMFGLQALGIDQYGFEVNPFLKPVNIDEVFYAHFMANPMSGKPYGGSALNILKNVGRSFVVGHKQTLDVAIRPTIDGKMQLGIVNGACLTPDHKVLHEDLVYRPLGELKVGDKLVSFEENLEGRRARRFKTGTVNAVRLVKKPVFQVKLASGKTFKVTEDHQWVVKLGGKYEWRETTGLRKGTRVPKFLTEWEASTTYESGWLAGLYDGEGCYYAREVGAGFVGQLSFSQRRGPVFDQAIKFLETELGQGTTITDGGGTQEDVSTVRIQGGVREIAKTLGVLRPARMIPKFKAEHLGRLTCDDGMLDTVDSVIYIGEMDVVMTDIDEHTMIVEGYGHHNCYLHDEAYKGYQGNNHFRGLTMLHNVADGYGDPEFISLRSIM